MADQPTTAPAEAPARPPVVVKKYANRRLYNTETSSYITLDNLAEMIRAGRDFIVYDAKSGDDITRGVLTQIIVEEESKGSSMLPTNFLRSLIGFYGDSLQGVVPSYLEQAMASFARQQQQMRQVVQQTFSPFIPVRVEEMSRQNMALIERAMTMFNPFHRGGEAAQAEVPQAGLPAMAAAAPELAPAPAGPSPEMESLRHEVASLRSQLAVAHAELVVGQTRSLPASEDLVPGVLQAPNVFADPPGNQATPLAVPRSKKMARKP